MGNQTLRAFTLVADGPPSVHHYPLVGRAGVEPAQLLTPSQAAYHQALRPKCGGATPAKTLPREGEHPVAEASGGAFMSSV